MTPREADSRLPEFARLGYAAKVLHALEVDGQDVIRPWGVEFADSSAFYSLEDGFGYRYEVLDDRDEIADSGRNLVQIIRMREGLVRLELRECLEGPRDHRRTCTLTCLEDTTLMDFVLRYRFRAGQFTHGLIAGKVLPYVGSGVYHQYPVDRASVGNPSYSITVEVLDRSIPAAMKGYVYLRDGEDAWVLHVRMLPERWDKEVIKLCSRWFGTRPLPQWLSAPILSHAGIRKALWYRGEFRPWRNRVARVFSPNAYPMVRLAKGQVLRWDARCTLGPPLGEAAKGDGARLDGSSPCS